MSHNTTKYISSSWLLRYDIQGLGLNKMIFIIYLKAENFSLWSRSNLNKAIKI